MRHARTIRHIEVLRPLATTEPGGGTMAQEVRGTEVERTIG